MMKRAFVLAAAAAILGFPAIPTGLAAQEEAQEEQQCELEPSETAVQAQTLVAEAQEAETPEAATAKYQEALATVEDRLGSDDAGAVLMGAVAHIGLGDYETADQLLDRFLELAPSCAEPARNTRYNAWVGLYNEAITAYQEGDSEVALEKFETANLIYADARSLNNAAFLYQQQGDIERAIELYRQASEADGDAEQIQNATINLADLLVAEERTEEALEVYGAYLEEHPDDNVMRIQYALALTEAGRTEEATPLFDEVLAAEGLTNAQWNQVGVGLFNAEQYAEAAQAFRKAYEANPYNKEALENLVASHVQAETAGEVGDLAPELVDRYPYDEANYALLARILVSTDRAQEAGTLMQTIEDAPMVFQSVQMAEADQATYVIRGTVEGREAGAGTTINVPFQLIGPDGSVVATQEIEIEVPPAGETSPFRVSVETDAEVAGFRYQKVGSDGIRE